MNFLNKSKWIILGGFIFGVLGALAVNWGNPNNMGICVACFFRDIAGSLKLHSATAVQYLRPEIFGFILGAFGTSIAFREWKPRGGSSPIIRFILAVCVMVGALVFLGCPIRSLLRLGGGDLSSLVAIVGLIVGVLVGIFFLKRGFSLGRSTKVPAIAGLVFPIIALVLFVFLIIKSGALTFSESGPGSLYVNPWLGLGIGVVVGFIVQRTRFCSIGCWRDIFLVKNFYLFSGVAAFLIGVLIANYIAGNFGADGPYHWGFTNQPIALPYADADGGIIWSQYIWSFLSFSLVGLAATLMGGCPLRNTILAGEGDTDAGISLLGYIAGGAIAMNFFIASGTGGMGKYGSWGVVVCLVICLAIGFIMREKEAA
ncbi:MAG: YedE family putative selenium transporter [Dehalococcoidia bacterium]|nr:YedE family putative selenium transporter [Dehalococcoidia bacterium]